MNIKPTTVYSVHYNRPDFIGLQVASLKAHMIDPYELIIVNNARDPYTREQINQTANSLGLKTIQTHSNTPAHLPGKHHADSLNYFWKNHAVNQFGNYVLILDGDCFLVHKFSVNNFMKDGVPLSGPKQHRQHKYEYLTPTVVIADIDLLPEPETINWEGIHLNGVALDTGGGLHIYLEKHNDIKKKTKAMHSTWHIKPENNNMHCLPDELLNSYDPTFNIEFFNNEFLHYCRSSNWDNCTPAYHKLKSDFVFNFVSETLNGCSIIAKGHNFQTQETTYFGWKDKE